MGLAAAATAANAWLMQPVLDGVFVNHDTTLLYLVPLAVIVSAVVKGASTYSQTMLMTRVGQRMLADLQRELFTHLMHADLAFFHDTPTGGLISRFTNDVALVRGAVTQSLTGIAKDMLTVVFLVGLMFYQDWEMAIVAFIAFPLAVFPILRIGRRLRKVSTSTQAEIGALAGLLEETFQGARHVKAYGMEEYESQRATGIIENLYNLVMKGTRTRTASHPIMETLGSFAVALVIFYGGSRVISGGTTPGVFFSFITALLLAYQPVKNLATLNANLQEGLAAAQRVFALLDVEPQIKDRPGARVLPGGSGEIRFEDVQFSYGPNKTALNGVSLVVPAGRMVALVGPSGGGKTTMINLIPRFYDAQAGRVTVNGADVRDVTLASLRRQIAIVSQEVSLFHDTVRANIAYGRPTASEEEIREAASLAGAAEFIEALPDGYDTIVGERGTKLSGGQRQRVSIARALLKNAPILLLDEATSSLDNESERAVQTALAMLMEGRTTLVVAHRLSTVADADIIYVVEDGRIVEHGQHAELIARGRTYARLYALQGGGELGVIEGARARA
ncbi:MAG: ABC transporter ATP-binding protein [Alphaproteobacteria bacterium]|nr:ABC transporter ATP-binding protein [Alphaproteobacteria bacterium]